MAKGKVISIVDGRIKGASFEVNEGLLLNGVCYDIVEQSSEMPNNVLNEIDVRFPYNHNCPATLDLNKLRNRKFRLTVELLDDDTKTSI